MLAAMTKEYPLSQELREKIDCILDAHEHDYTQIVNILMEVQDLNEKHYVPEPVAYYLAKKLEIPLPVFLTVLPSMVSYRTNQGQNIRFRSVILPRVG